MKLVKIFAAPIEPRLVTRNVEYTMTDAFRLGQRALETNEWQYLADHGGGTARRKGLAATDTTETVVAIASPDGRVGVWYAQTFASDITTYIAAGASLIANGLVGPTVNTTHVGAVIGVLKSSTVRMRADLLVRKHAAMLWDQRHTRGGARDITPLARAACRLVHAEAFGDEPLARDQYLCEMLTLRGSNRPYTKTITSASDAALAAASALLMVDDRRGVRVLLANANKIERAL